MTARFRGPVVPAQQAARSGAPVDPSVPAVSASLPPAPVSAESPTGRPPVTLAQFGDVMTDRDLAALLQMSPSFARHRRELAARTGLAPNLPAAIPGMGKLTRYLTTDVERWLKTGSSARGVFRRSA